MEARQAHNLEVVGSSPSPATENVHHDAMMGILKRG